MRTISLIVSATILLAIMGCDSKETYKWKPAPNPLMTQWAADVDPGLPWPQYPRPQMQRDQWMNLNGLWDYQLVRSGEGPIEYTGKILVPYPVESSLSGIADSVGPGDVIYYRREFEIPGTWKGKNILLNFEAADWETKVVVNGMVAGTHKGGYDPFTFNITEALNENGVNELLVEVKDPTNEGYQPRGKQVLAPHGIWYTPSSGIWQTVWLEPVPEAYIEAFFIKSLPAEEKINILFNCEGFMDGDVFKIQIKEGSTIIQEVVSAALSVDIVMPDFKWWSPEDPFLYDMDLSLIRNGEAIDMVRSYFGMRSISKGMADDGFVRLFLNDRPVFHNGPLDQGFWPDGLYTPPTDEAMRYDIQVTKDLGFNMLRKHVKVENRRFYYWCDKLGIMVWQDMPSTSGYVGPDKPDLERPAHEVIQFRYELERMIETKFNHPSIVMWVPFNEGWGQFDTEGIVEFIKGIDASRLVNNTSGWADRSVGDVTDIHHYPEPRCPEPESERASVLGEFGGLGYYVEGHTWEEKNWGYKKMDDSASLIMKYAQFYDTVWHMMENGGLAAAVYTQTTDVETETNGLMTYDRSRIKMDQKALQKINTNTKEIMPPVYFNPFDERFSGGGFFAMLDGRYGSMDHDDGHWQGYRDNEMDIMIDLGKLKRISSVSGNFLQKHEGWIFLPQIFSVSTSIDKKEFTLQGEIRSMIPEYHLEAGIHMLSVDNLDVEARYVRVKAVGIGPAPKWLEVARERPTWIFIDEIIIN